MVDSPPKSIALAILPKTTAFLSICGSSAIVVKVARNRQSRTETMPRIMAAMSTCDALVSASFFASTWPVPEGTPTSYGDGTQPIFGAMGNDISCNMAGFFTQFSVVLPLFNSTLATYYLLVVYHGWADGRIERIEWLFYALPIFFALFAATFCVAANLIGPVEWTCAIKPSELSVEGAELTPIQSHFLSMRWIFLFGPVWACLFYISIIFTVLYKKYRAMEERMKRYTVSGGRESTITRTRQSHKVAVQGLRYFVAFYITWLFPTISRIYELAGVKKHYVIQLCDTFFLPLQGFLNGCIYLRPSIEKHRRLNPNDSFYATLKAVIFS